MLRIGFVSEMPNAVRMIVVDCCCVVHRVGLVEHTSFFEGFSSVGLICVKTIIIDYIRPVEFNGDTLEILG